MNTEFFSLIQECSNKYFVKNFNENEIQICIRIPKKLKTLWLIKLSELKTNQNEIEIYKDNDD